MPMILVHVMSRGESVFRQPSQEMRPNFILDEMKCKCGCDTAIAVEDQMNLVQGARDFIGRSLEVTSWYRCRKHNLAEGGIDRSKHQSGEATDLAINPNLMSETVKKLFIEAMVTEFKAKEIVFYYNKNFIHLSVAMTGNHNRVVNGIECRIKDKRG